MSLLTKVAADIAAEKLEEKTAQKLAENLQKFLEEQARREGRELPSAALTGISTVGGDEAHISRGHRVDRRPRGGGAER